MTWFLKAKHSQTNPQVNWKRIKETKTGVAFKVEIQQFCLRRNVRWGVLFLWVKICIEFIKIWGTIKTVAVSMKVKLKSYFNIEMSSSSFIYLLFYVFIHYIYRNELTSRPKHTCNTTWIYISWYDFVFSTCGKNFGRYSPDLGPIMNSLFRLHQRHLNMSAFSRTNFDSSSPIISIKYQLLSP